MADGSDRSENLRPEFAAMLSRIVSAGVAASPEQIEALLARLTAIRTGLCD